MTTCRPRARAAPCSSRAPASGVPAPRHRADRASGPRAPACERWPPRSPDEMSASRPRPVLRLAVSRALLVDRARRDLLGEVVRPALRPSASSLMCSYCRARLLPGFTPAGGIEAPPCRGTKPMYPERFESNTVCRRHRAGRTGAMSTTAPTRTATPASGDPRDDARAVGLRYVSDDRPGITRHRTGRGFTYRDANGVTIRDAGERERIAVARDPAGLDETSGSARTRAATSWRPAATRAAASSTATTRAGARCATTTKFDRMLAFAGARCPQIRVAASSADLALARPAAREGAGGRGRRSSTTR